MFSVDIASDLIQSTIKHFKPLAKEDVLLKVIKILALFIHYGGIR